MTAAATRPPFAEAQPAEIRAALLAEERSDFDHDYQHALATAANQLDLDELHETLTRWRRVAALTQADPHAQRRMLAQAEHTLRTRQRPAGSVPWSQLKEELGL